MEPQSRRLRQQAQLIPDKSLSPEFPQPPFLPEHTLFTQSALTKPL